jgi:hypothetical protein
MFARSEFFGKQSQKELQISSNIARHGGVDAFDDDRRSQSAVPVFAQFMT